MAQSQVKEDPKAAAFMDKIRSWIPAFNGTTAQVPTPPVVTPVAGGGGGNGAGNGNAGGGGGGNGNNGNPSEPFFGRKEKQVLLYAVLFFASIPAVIYANKMVLEMTRTTPSAATAPASPQAAAVPSTQSNVVRNVDSFDCSTDQKRDEGFPNAEVNQLTAGSTLQVSYGCAIIVANAGATKLDAQKYQLFVLDSEKPGWSFKCGDVIGNSNAQCQRFMQDHAGKPIRVVVRSGGRVMVTG